MLTTGQKHKYHKNKQVQLQVSNDVGLEVNTDEPTYRFVSALGCRNKITI
jgi:hypothetical protein